VAYLAAVAAVAAKKDKCYALAMSGGANNGAWEIGVMWGLAHYGNPKDFEWDVVTGISTGAINTIYMAVWEPSAVVKMTEMLSEIMATTVNDNIWKNWTLGPLWGLLEKPSLLNDDPMAAYFDWLISDFNDFKRRFTVGTVDISSGEFVTFDQTNIVKAELANAAKSSASIPGVFQPNHFKSRWFMDGGTVFDINVDSAVQQCMEVVDDPADIIVDVMICGVVAPPAAKKRTWNTITNVMRTRSWSSYYSGTNSIVEQMKAYPDVSYRYLFEQKVTSNNPLKFTNETTWPLQEEGRKDAMDALEEGEQVGFVRLEEWVKENEPHMVPNSFL